MCVGEAEAITGERINVWRGDQRRAITTGIVVAEIIRDHQDDIGLGRFQGGLQQSRWPEQK